MWGTHSNAYKLICTSAIKLYKIITKLKSLLWNWSHLDNWSTQPCCWCIISLTVLKQVANIIISFCFIKPTLKKCFVTMTVMLINNIMINGMYHNIKKSESCRNCLVGKYIHSWKWKIIFYTRCTTFVCMYPFLRLLMTKNKLLKSCCGSEFHLVMAFYHLRVLICTKQS